MKAKRLACVLILTLLVLPLSARADVLLPGQKPPRNEQSEVFVKLYADKLTGWDSAYNNAFDGVEELILWRYPNSGWVVGRSNSQWFSENVSLAETFTQCYVDESGRVWGYINYIYGQKMNWICISNPGNTNLPADETTVAAVEQEVKAMELRESIPTIALVAGVVLITGGFIYVFWFKKKKRG